MQIRHKKICRRQIFENFFGETMGPYELIFYKIAYPKILYRYFGKMPTVFLYSAKIAWQTFRTMKKMVLCGTLHLPKHLTHEHAVR